MALPVEAFKLEGISPRAYQHPADRAASAALQRVPYLDEVVRRLIALGYERALHAVTLGAAIRLGERQLPGVWVLHREVFHVLDLDDAVPDLYLTQFPFANAYTIGSQRPDRAVELPAAGPARRRRPSRGARARGGARALRPRPVPDRAAHPPSARLLAPARAGRAAAAGASGWRCSSGSAPPSSAATAAAALVTRDATAVCRSLMALAAGAAADELNLDAFIAQAAEYDEGGTGLDRLTKLMNDLHLTHPMPVRRVRELTDWVAPANTTGSSTASTFAAADEPPLKDEADGASAHYADRIGGSSSRRAPRSARSASSWRHGCRGSAELSSRPLASGAPVDQRDAVPHAEHRAHDRSSSRTRSLNARRATAASDWSSVPRHVAAPQGVVRHESPRSASFGRTARSS